MSGGPPHTPLRDLAKRDGDAALDRFLTWVSGLGLELYPAQEEALLELFTGRHVLLSTPTGSGKSLVAIGLHFKALCEGRRSFYTAPIKALVSEKFFALCDEFGPENVGMLTGDASINWSAPIICCTAEVLANMVLHQGEDCDAPYVVMDEFHYYSDRERGVAWQLPLLILRDTTFLLMSATLGNTAELEERIRIRTGRLVAHVHSETRPVPLDYHYRETPILDSVEWLLAEGRLPVYLVHFTQRHAAEQAQALTSAKFANREQRKQIGAAIRDARFDTPYARDVQRLLRHGIGLHHAGLLPKYRLLVERLSQRGMLTVICGTDTLGVGVNLPIRTVLFTRLCKFDGEKVGILSVRNFRQIAGRAGRRGFDDRGSVVCQAPEHVVENKRLEAKAAAKGGKRFVKKKAPTRGFVPWNEDTFAKLIERPPEALVSRFRVDHGMLVSLLKRDAHAGYSELIQLIGLSHESPRRKRRLRRECAVLIRSLRRAGVVEVERNPDREGSLLRLRGDLQREFSLHHSLSLYLVEAVTALEPQDMSYVMDLLGLVEAILENPRPILEQQVRKAREELLAKLKAERVPYEERMARLEEVTWPKPAASFIYATFNLFAESHPWVGTENIQPKSIAREMFESCSSFGDYVRRYGLQPMEGRLLRYLAQVHDTLVRSVPETARSEGVLDAIAFFRTMLARTDSSLLEEWERQLDPTGEGGGRGQGESQRAGGPEPARSAESVPMETRVRAELHQLVRALASRRFEEAAACIRADPDEPWTAERLEAALAPYFDEYETIVFDPQARQKHHTLIREREPQKWDVYQVLVDPRGENLWNIEVEVDLVGGRSDTQPVIRLRRIGT